MSNIDQIAATYWNLRNGGSDQAAQQQPQQQTQGNSVDRIAQTYWNLRNSGNQQPSQEQRGQQQTSRVSDAVNSLIARGNQMRYERAANAYGNEMRKAARSGLNNDQVYQQMNSTYNQSKTANQKRADEIGTQLNDLETNLVNGVKTISTPQGLQNVPLTYEEEQDLKQQIASLRSELDRIDQENAAVSLPLSIARANRYRDVASRKDYSKNVEAGKRLYAQMEQTAKEQRAQRELEANSGNVETAGYNYSELDQYYNKLFSDSWTDEEKNTYLYLLGANKGDPSAAYEYAESVWDSIAANQRAARMGKVEQTAQNLDWLGGALGTGAKVATSPLGLWDYLGSVVEQAQTGHIRPRAELSPRDYANALESGNAQRLNERYGTIQNGLLAGKGLGDVYQLGNSVAESIAWAQLSKGIMAAGGPEKLAAGVTNLGFFGNSADQTTQEALKRGATSDQALMLGLLSGAAEAAGETFSVENLIHMSDPVELGGVLMNLVQQAGVEASEEGFTTILNSFADRIVMGDKSELNEKVNGYIANGMTRQEAEKKAWTEWTQGLAIDMIGGALSGGASGGLNMAGMSVQNRAPSQQTNQNAQTQTRPDAAELLTGVQARSAENTNTQAPNLAEPRTPAQQRVTRLLNAEMSEEQLRQVAEVIKDDPALASAYYELTGQEIEDFEASIPERPQNGAGEGLTSRGEITPDRVQEGQQAASREFNSGNQSGEGRELPTSPNSSNENPVLRTNVKDAKLEAAIKAAETSADPNAVYSASGGDYVMLSNGSIRSVETGEIVYERETNRSGADQNYRPGWEAEGNATEPVPSDVGRRTDLTNRNQAEQSGFRGLTEEKRRAVINAVNEQLIGNLSEETEMLVDLFGSLDEFSEKVYNDYSSGDPVGFEQSWGSAFPDFELLQDRFDFIRDSSHVQTNGGVKNEYETNARSEDEGQNSPQVYTLGMERGTPEASGRPFQNEGVEEHGEGAEDGSRSGLIGNPGENLAPRTRTEQKYAIREAELEIVFAGGKILNIGDLPQKTRKAVEHFIRDNPNIPLIVYRGSYNSYGPAYAYAQGPKGSAVVCLDPELLEILCPNITVQMALNHESGHVYIYGAEGNSVRLHERVKAFVRGDAELIEDLITAYRLHATNYHRSSTPGVLDMHQDASKASAEMPSEVFDEKETMWNEVFSDLYAGIDRAFPGANVYGSDAQLRFTKLVNCVRSVFKDELVPAYNSIVEGKEITQASDGAGTAQRDESKPESSKNDNPATNRNSERESDKPTPKPGPTEVVPDEPDSSAEYSSKPQRDARSKADQEAFNQQKQKHEDERTTEEAEFKAQDKEDEERLREQEAQDRLADAKKAFGQAHERLMGLGKKLSDLVGTKRVQTSARGDVHEAFSYRDGGRDIEPVVKAFNGMLSGDNTFEDVVNAYHGLATTDRDSKMSGYFFDGSFNHELEGIMEDIKSGNVTNKDGSFKPDFVARIEKAGELMAHRFGVQQKELVTRAEASEAFEGGPGKVKEGAKQDRANFFKRLNLIQLRPSTAFKSFAGYAQKAGKTFYDLAKKSRDSVRNYINTYQTAQEYFRELTNHKDWKNFSQGKIQVRNVVPGLKGNTLSANMALGYLKTLETDGAIEHIVENGIVETARNEKEYWSGRANKGFGTKNGYSQIFDMVSKETRAEIEKAIEKGDDYALDQARDKAAHELENVKKALKTEIAKVDVAQKAYEASFKVMGFLKRAMNKTSRSVWGVDFATQDKFYWPLSAGGDRAGGELLNGSSWGLNNYRNIQKREGSRGGLRIEAFTDVMENYIRQASSWAAYQGLSDELDLLSRNYHGTKSLTQLLQDNVGSHAVKWLNNYVADLNGTRDGERFAWLGKMRGKVAQGSLLLNGSVALKQAPSGLDFMGILDSDIVAKRFATGFWRSARHFKNNELINTVNQYTGMLTNRQMGYNIVEQGEAAEAGRKDLVGKAMDALPGWMTNWITKTDYRTVANGMLACADQIDRYIKNGVGEYKGMEKGSDAYYEAVADLFERAVIDTQPIYNKEYRADYLRTPNEFIRTLGMFRTQQTQNYNNFVESIGELQAAKREGTEAEIKAAQKRVRGTIGGQMAAAMMFSILGTAAKLLLHKKKDYEDDEGKLDWNKVIQRTGFNALNSALSTSWLGSMISPFLIDRSTQLLNKASGGKVVATNEYYSTEDSVLGLFNDIADSGKALMSNPTPKAWKSFVLSTAAATGLPLRNVYNMLNTVAMYSLDLAPGMKGYNYKNEDDFMNILTEWYAADAKTRAKITTQRALSLRDNKNYDLARVLFGSLDPTDKESEDAIRKELTNAFVLGKLDELTYRHFLQNYAKVDRDAVNDLVDAGKEKASFQAAQNRATGGNEERAKEQNSELKAYTGDNDPNGAQRMELILSYNLSADDTDAYVNHYMASKYRDYYGALRESGFSPARANKIIQAVNADRNTSISQAELWAAYESGRMSEAYIEMLWNASGYKKSWADYKRSKGR